MARFNAIQLYEASCTPRNQLHLGDTGTVSTCKNRQGPMGQKLLEPQNGPANKPRKYGSKGFQICGFGLVHKISPVAII